MIRPGCIALGIWFASALVAAASPSIAERLQELHDLVVEGERDAALATAEALAQDITAVAAGKDAYLARLHWEISQIHLADRDLPSALKSAETSLSHAEALQRPETLIAAIYRLERGKILLELGRIDDAASDFETALPFMNAEASASLLALDARRHLALAEAERGNRVLAHRMFLEVLEHRRAFPNAAALATALMDVASAELGLDVPGLGAATAAEKLLSQTQTLVVAEDLPRQAELAVVRGRIALQRSKLDAAVAAFSTGAALAGDDIVRRAHASLLEAQAEALRGRVLRSEELHVAALRLLREGLGGAHPILGRTLLGLGLVNAELGRADDAIAYLKEAIMIFETSAGIGSHPAAEARVELSMIFSSIGDYSSARSMAEAALEVLEEDAGRSELRRAYGQSALGFALRGVGDHDAAIDSFERALDRIRRFRGADSSDLPPGLIQLAEIKTDAGTAQMLAEAQDHLNEAWRVLKKDAAAGPRLMGSVLAAEIRLLSRRGETEKAKLRARDAITAIMLELDQEAAACDLRPAEVGAIHRLHTIALDALAAGDTLTEAEAAVLFQDAQLGHTGTTAQAINAAALRSRAEPRMRALLERRHSLRTKFCTLRAAVLRQDGGLDRSLRLDRDAATSRLERISAELDQLDARIGAGRGDRDRLTYTVADVKASLELGEAVLMQVTGESGTHLFWLDQNGIAHEKTGLSTPVLRDAVAQLRRSVQIANVRPDDPLPDVPLDAAHALYRGIFAPFEGRLGSARTVFFVPDDHVRAISPALFLKVAPPKSVAWNDPSALAELDWLGSAATIAIIPSPGSLVALRERVDRDPGRVHFVGIGNPMFSSLDDALSGTEQELRRLAQILAEDLSAHVVTGPQASEGWVRTAPEVREARVLAFATHGLLSDEAGAVAEPALLLTTPVTETAEDDGYLMASEIASLDLKADWVILSACNTGAGRDRRAEGLSGLAEAFFAAKASSLLVSHWYVPSSSSGALTVFTAEELSRSDGNRANALRRAMARVRLGMDLDGSHNPRFGHPAFWAPFVVVGETS